MVGFFSCGGGLIQAAVGIGGSCGLLFLNRFGLARNAALKLRPEADATDNSTVVVAAYRGRDR